jgi:hypothetical protein
MEYAGAASAGLMLESRLGAHTPPASATLHLLLWGSGLYAFSADGKSVEVAYLTKDPKVPGCTFVPHAPAFKIPAGGGKFTSDSTFTTGAIPEGGYAITGVASPATLTAKGLTETPAACAGSAKAVSSLAFVPSLAATGVKPAANWRDRFGIRFRFEAGEIRAHAPLHGEKELARWEVRGGPSTGSQRVWPFTDTLELIVPLQGNSVTFAAGANKATIAAVGNSKRIDLHLLAHPPMANQPELKVDQAEPHFCSLYALYDPIPQSGERAELFFKDWCVPQTAIKGPVKLGPSPGKYCTGAKVII